MSSDIEQIKQKLNNIEECINDINDHLEKFDKYFDNYLGEINERRLKDILNYESEYHNDDYGFSGIDIHYR